MNKKKYLIILCLIIALFCLCYYISIIIIKRSFKNKLDFIQKNIDIILNKNNIDIPLLYINLSRSPDRKNFMEKQFNQYNVSTFTRIDAVDSKLLKLKSKR